MTTAAELRTRLEQALEHRIPRALTPPQRPSLERMLTGIASVDALTGGIPLGCLTEICGPSSSGRSSILLQILVEFMRRDETCALIDAGDAFDPHSAAAAGVELGRLLWIRCNSFSPRRHRGTEKKKSATDHWPSAPSNKPFLAESRQPIADSRLEQALKSTDLLLQAGGFGVVVLDLGDIPMAAARRIPLTTWFRFRRAVENTSTAFIVIEQTPHAKSCATLVMDLTAQQASWSEASDQDGIVMGAHAGNPAPLFRVTAEGIAISFEQSATSFTMPQRWSTPHARLLNTVHVHLQVTRSRSVAEPHKFPAKPAFEFANTVLHHGGTEAQNSSLWVRTVFDHEEALQIPVA